MTRDTQRWEEELKEAGWEPLAKHPNSPIWRAPSGQLFAGPGYAWLVLQEQKNLKDKQQ